MDVLTELLILLGVPASIKSNNGSEVIAQVVEDGITAVGPKTVYIVLGSPSGNRYCESLNARFREELLYGKVVYSLQEAQVFIEA